MKFFFKEMLLCKLYVYNNQKLQFRKILNERKYIFQVSLKILKSEVRLKTCKILNIISYTIKSNNKITTMNLVSTYIYIYTG